MDNEIDFEPEKNMEILTAWDDFKKIHEKEYNLMSEEEKKTVMVHFINLYVNHQLWLTERSNHNEQ